MGRRRLRRGLAAALVACAVLATACSSDDATEEAGDADGAVVASSLLQALSRMPTEAGGFLVAGFG